MKSEKPKDDWEILWNKNVFFNKKSFPEQFYYRVRQQTAQEILILLKELDFPKDDIVDSYFNLWYPLIEKKIKQKYLGGK